MSLAYCVQTVHKHHSAITETVIWVVVRGEPQSPETISVRFPISFWQQFRYLFTFVHLSQISVWSLLSFFFFFFPKHFTLLFRCCLEKEDRRCSASSSLSQLFLEKGTFCSETRQTDWRFCQLARTSVRWWGWIMWPCWKASGMKVLTIVGVWLLDFPPRTVHLCGFCPSYLRLTQGFFTGSSLEDSVMRWCCISEAEQKKCEQWALNINSDPLVCVRALSVRDCIMKIKVRGLNHITQSFEESSGFHYNN